MAFVRIASIAASSGCISNRSLWTTGGNSIARLSSKAIARLRWALEGNRESCLREGASGGSGRVLRGGVV